MSLQSVVDQIVRAGGVLKLEGDRIKYRLPERVAHLADDMKRRKSELVELLRKVGDRMRRFPTAPAARAMRCIGKTTSAHTSVRLAAGRKSKKARQGD